MVETNQTNEMLDKLRDYGADIDGAMSRFLDDVDLYQSCFAIFLADESFPGLQAALEAQDYRQAFECAHTLKGVAGNMGLTPLYQVICNMVEDLRRNEYAALQDYWAQILTQLQLLEALQA